MCHNLQNHVKILCHCNDLKGLRLEHNIGLTCSSREAFGRVTIENMMAGLLVIGANSGGTSEIVQNEQTGLLYCVDDALDLSRCLKFVIENPEQAAAITKQGQKYAIDTYAIGSVVDRILDVYKNIISDRF